MSSSEGLIVIFIKLTNTDGNTKYLVNASQIHLIYRQHIHDRTVIMLDGNYDNRWYVKETPEQIEELIKGINNGT